MVKLFLLIEKFFCLRFPLALFDKCNEEFYIIPHYYDVSKSTFRFNLEFVGVARYKTFHSIAIRGGT